MSPYAGSTVCHGRRAVRLIWIMKGATLVRRNGVPAGRSLEPDLIDAAVRPRTWW